ncbi:hypothetical protein [Roseivivax marinus]|uniref:hypothetical protein n=1 Tax=Roseivivax marinus TaxID=1379903 RepID=UPI003CC80113
MSEVDMQKRNAPIIAATLVLAGCAVPTLDDGGARNEVGSVPEAVIALAAPGQDLTTARLRPEDGCYWYEHSGPVENTLVPLRSTGGNPICTSRQS